MIPCPSCRGQMRPVVEAGVEIDVCDGCSAIWLDSGELNDVADSGVDQVTDVLVGESSHVRLSCPRCGGDDFCDLKIITKALSEPVHVSRCDGCSGVFVNNDNLDRLRGQLPQQQRTNTRSISKPARGSGEEGTSEPGMVAEVAVETVGNGLIELLIHVICSIV